MSESIVTVGGTKEEKYLNILPQIKGLVRGESDLIANMANIIAALKEQFNWWWIGFYLVKNDELVVGPFQGPIACTRIKKGRGVCGTAWEKREPIIVDDVNQFPGHIACSAYSKSEIVIPIYSRYEIIGVLDIDDDKFASFDETDQKFLEEVVRILEEHSGIE